MIDTIKLAIPYQERPEWLATVKKKSSLDSGKSTLTTRIFASKSYKQTDMYLPQLQFVETPSWIKGEARISTLYVEASLPKLFFGNNFDELTNELFSAVINKLSVIIWTIYDIKILPSVIAKASVVRIDYSKNIVFTDRTPVSSIIDVVAGCAIPKTYDVEKTNFRNGGMIYHIHANIIDIVFYDKVADLAQAKVSEKRSVESYNYTQLKLVEEFEKHPDISVPRFEIRLNTKRRIRKELNAIGFNEDLSFYRLFNADISKKILLRHWESMTASIPKTDSLSKTPSQILISCTNNKPGMKFAEASAHTLMRLLRDELQEERAVRNIIESLFGNGQYTRLKNLGRNPLTNTQLSHLLHISQTITEMKPINIAEFIHEL